MKKAYREPSLEVKLYKLPLNSVFTASGDKLDDDVYDITGLSPQNSPDMDVFGN